MFSFIRGVGELHQITKHAQADMPSAGVNFLLIMEEEDL